MPIKSPLSRLVKDESGQIIPWLVFLSILIIGAAGLTLDLGHAYICYRKLQGSTDAAALAGAYYMTLNGETQAEVSSEVTAYSSTPGTGANQSPNLPQANITTTSYKCITDSPLVTIQCTAFNTATTGSPNGDNVIVVTQTAVVPTYFIRVLSLFAKGPPVSLTLTSTATAAMESGPPKQVNVAMIVDTTASMGNEDSDPLCNNTQINCALAGVQTMLSYLTPCAAGYTSSSCTAYDQVSIFTFPPFQASTASADTDCGGSSSPTIEPYSTPAAGATWSAPTGTATTYQVTGFLSNYSSTNGSGGSSNSSSALIKATGKSTSSCPGMATPGGDGTYYAGVIYAAQSALMYEQSLNSNTENIMIILSDGDATATSGKVVNSSGGNVGNNGAIYPSLQDQCAQAIKAAQYATNQGTIVYTVAYGAESSGCTSDATDTTYPTLAGVTPCQAMEQMSSGWPANTSHFFSDSTESGEVGACPSANGGSLNEIFQNLTGQFANARLLPNGIS
jgi:hypothetical protein